MSQYHASVTNDELLPNVVCFIPNQGKSDGARKAVAIGQWQLKNLALGWNPPKFRFYLKLNWRRPIFFEAWEDEYTFARIVRSPEGTDNCARIGRLPYHFSTS